MDKREYDILISMLFVLLIALTLFLLVHIGNLETATGAFFNTSLGK